ncbi:hypothetical protein BGZ88_004243, partial [Linnemannia elongata]
MAYITLACKYHLLLQSYYAETNAMLSDTVRTAFLAGAPVENLGGTVAGLTFLKAGSG